MVEESSVIERRQLRISDVPDEANFEPNFESSKVSKSGPKEPVNATTDQSSAKSADFICNSRERSYMNDSNVIAGTRNRRKRKFQ